MRKKKLLSLITAISILAGMTSAVHARSQVVETTDVIRNLDFTDVTEGHVTSDKLAEMGFQLKSDAAGVSAPAVEFKKVEEHVDGSSNQITALALTISKGMKFTLTNDFNIPDKNGEKPSKVNVSYWYFVEHPTNLRPSFWCFGQLSKAGAVDFISPIIDKDSWNKLDSSDTEVGYLAFGQWNRMEYEIDYTTNKAKITKSLTWGDTKTFEKDITTADTPNCLTWKQTSSLSTWGDADVSTLYFDDIQITATYNETIYDEASATSTFFDTTDGNSTELAVYSNNVYQAGEYGTLTAANRTELPANIDYIGYRFDGATNCENAKLIVAQYSDKVLPELVNASIDDVAVRNSTASTKSPLNLTQKTGTYVQAFLWDGFSKITPLADNAEAQIVPNGTTLLDLDFEDCRANGCWAYNKDDNTFTNASSEKVTTPNDNYGGFANYFVKDADDHVVLENSADYAWTTAIVPGETAKFGTNALRAYAAAPTTYNGNNIYPGFVTKQANAVLSSALRDATANNTFRISFYAKATQADAEISAKIRTRDSYSANYYNQFSIFRDLIVKAGDWQHFVIYFAPRSDGEVNWTAKFDESDYDMLEISMNSKVEQPIYFDNIKIEQVN